MSHSVKDLCCTITYVCGDCGDKYGKYDQWAHTWHQGTCGICGKEAGVTHVRHFGWLKGYRCKCEVKK